MTEEFAAPTGSFLVAEAPTVLQVPRLALWSTRLRSAPNGSASIVTFPGFGTNDLSLGLLRGFLRSKGHQPIGWGLGVNVDDVQDRIDEATAIVQHRAEQHDEPVVLIGWSYGGVFAREIARNEPELVRSVITLGTPIFGGPRYSRSARFYSEDRLAVIDQLIAERRDTPIDCPLTSFYTQKDGAVDWRVCLDEETPGARNIEMTSTHNGLTIDPEVWVAIAELLADR